MGRKHRNKEANVRVDENATEAEEIPLKRSATIGEKPSSSPRLFLLYGIVILQVTIFVTEMVIDNFVHSLLILADAYHHLFNCCNAILMVVCFKISNQVTVKNTFGWVRLELLGMLTTITFIVALIFSMVIEGFLQLLHLHEIPEPTNFNVLIIFGAWSLTVNMLYVLVINGIVTEKKYKQTTRTERSFSTAKCNQSGSSDNIPLTVIASDQIVSSSDPSSDSNNNTAAETNKTQLGLVYSLFQGVLSPTLLAVSTLLIVIFRKSEFVQMVDPAMGVLAAILLCFSFYPQLKNTMLILMQTMPENVNIMQLKKEILETFSEIQNIHEFHIWRLTSSKIVATCHIVLPAQTTRQYRALFETIKTFLHRKYGIAYVTIQPEFRLEENQESSASREERQADQECLMRCPRNCVDGDHCEALTCCATPDPDHQLHHHHGHSHLHHHP